MKSISIAALILANAALPAFASDNASLVSYEQIERSEYDALMTQHGEKRAVANIALNVEMASQLNVDKSINFTLPSGKTVSGKVVRRLKDAKHSLSPDGVEKLVIALSNGNGAIELWQQHGETIGLLINNTEDQKIYTTQTAGSGHGILYEHNVDSFQCAEYPQADHSHGTHAHSHSNQVNLNLSGTSEQNIEISGAVPDLAELQNLQSRPGAAKTIYLNNWGGTLSGTAWNDSLNGGADIVYTAYDRDGDATTFTESERYLIWLAWKETAEDYAGFDVNVTTSQAVYDATTSANRSQIIATTTNYFYPGAGGVAYVGIFGFSSDYYKTGFTWNSGATSMGMTHSHEAGHQLGLSHDGTASLGYYSGHGSWGPIMGAPFGKQYVQWSQGEYNGANQQQDDLSIIGNMLGVVADDAGDTNETATALSLPESGRVGTISSYGINSASDTDVYMFQLANATEITIEVKSVLGVEDEARAANLAFSVNLRDANNQIIASHASSENSPLRPTTNVFSNVSTLQAGTYYIEIYAQSPDSDWSTGFNEYGNGGDYQVSVTGVINDNITVSTQETGLSADQGQEIRRVLQVPTGATNVTVTMAGATGDADLYTRANDAPTTNLWDCRPLLSGSNETCSDQAAGGPLHYMALATGSFTDVTLSTSYEISGSADSDNDGLTNSEEVNLGTDPAVADTDGDGLSDGDEVNTYGTNPTNSDTDNDGFSDAEDSDPLTAADSDNDGWDNSYERNSSALDEFDPSDVWSDSDNDARPLIFEELEGFDSSQNDNDVLNDTRSSVLQAYFDTTAFNRMQSIYETIVSGSDTEIDQKVSELNNNTTTISELYADLLADSNSDFELMGFIGRVYIACFNRNADFGGAQYYRERISTQRMTRLQMVSNFVNSNEFNNRYGSELTSQEFMTLVYNNVFGRNPDQGGLDYWSGRLDAGTITRAELMLQFINSNEFTSNTSTERDSEQRIRVLALILIKRALTDEEVSRFVDWYKNDTNGLLSVVKAMLGNANFFSRMQVSLDAALDTDDDERPDVVEFADGTDINVSDNDPINSSNNFVRQMYRDLASENWSVDNVLTDVTNLDAAPSNGEWLAGSSVLSESSFEAREEIVRLYAAIFSRTPDFAGLNYWLSRYVDDSLDLSAIAATFVAGGEFTGLYGSLSNSDFVTQMYQNVFSRLPDTGGLTYWTNRLDTDLSRGDLLLAFSESTEGKNKLAATVTTAILYHYLLERRATSQEISDGETLVNGGNLSTLINNIINSAEYSNRF